MKRIMALDVGDRRIGVAVSDPMGVIARSLEVIVRRTDESAIERISALAREQDVGKIVVGFPRSLSGDVGTQARAVESFAGQLQKVVDVPLILWDERLSTVTAVRLMRERGQSARDSKATIDAVAAAVILQNYLDAQSVRSALEQDRSDSEDD
jgi:putative Holliday junction resolvase